MEDIRQRVERLRRELREIAPALKENPELQEILPVICIDCGKTIVDTYHEGDRCPLLHTIPTCLMAKEVDEHLKGKKRREM